MTLHLPSRNIYTGTFSTTSKVHQYIGEVLDSERISYGDKSRAFEQQFAALHASKYATLSNSGTSSLHVALQTLKEIHFWNSGDEVIIPATTFVATANIIRHNLMNPIFVDIESDYYGIDVTKIEEKITDRTRAIIPVHLFGQSCNMTAIMEIAEKYNLKIIEDSCEAMFVKHHDAPVGSMGDIGCFSMYVAHLITAGVGGISITNNPEYAAKMRSLVNHGLQIADLNLDEHMSPQPMLNRRFHFEDVGHSFRITEFEAAVALAQLEDHKDMLKIRRRNGKHYTASLKLINSMYEKSVYHAAQIADNNEHAYMMYSLLLNKRNGKIISKKPYTDYLNEQGIETRDMLPILGQPAYLYLSPSDYPISHWVAESGFYVGCHQGLTVDDVQYVLNALSSAAHDNKE